MEFDLSCPSITFTVKTFWTRFASIVVIATSLNAQFLVLGQTFLSDLPVPDGIVYSVKYDAGAQVVYIGGAFTHVDGQPRNHLASIDVLNGTLTSWNPNVNGIVYAMQWSSDTLYVGGEFGVVGTTARNNLAAFALSSGALTSWNPSTNGTVRAIDLASNTAYVGGEFTSIGTTPVPHVGGIGTQGTGAVTSCIPSDCDAQVRSLRVHGAVFWMGGDFGQVGGSMRAHLAALNSSSCGTTSWNPSADGQVNFVSEGSGTDVHVAGSFQNVGGQFRNGVAAINKNTGNATIWDANCDGEGRCLAANSWVLFVGGQFDHLGGQPRNGLGAVRLSDGGDVGWDPELENGDNPVIVNSLSTRGIGVDYVFAGGDFQTVGGTLHPYFAAWSGMFTNLAESNVLPVLNLYPNPVDDILNMDGDLGNARALVIQNVLGERVFSVPVSHAIDLSFLSPGAYFITLLDDEGVPQRRASLIRR